MKAYIFPGQGSQFPGMGLDLFEGNAKAKAMFDEADSVLGFAISKEMFEGTAESLKATRITQPAIFLHSVIKAACIEDFKPEMVAGHSLGEFSALVANKCLNFSDALTLVYKRAQAMQKACEMNPSTMAAVLGLEDSLVEEICASIQNDIVVCANYNCPGQLVISGSIEGVNLACEKLKEAGARRALILPVGGAFHSPLMGPAQIELESAIASTEFKTPICPVYQNVSTTAVNNPDEIRKNLIKQLTAPVRWTQSIQNMINDGATLFTEVGPGNVLQGLVKKINKEAETAAA